MASYDVTTKSDGLFEKLVHVNRTAKVVKGGRRFGFTATVVVGDGKGKVGFGSGKAAEVSLAIKKAMERARKSMAKVSLHGDTLHYSLQGKHGASCVMMHPAPQGTGIIAGGAVRAVFEVLGVQNVVTKVIGSTTPVNVVKAVVNGLLNMTSPDTLLLSVARHFRKLWRVHNGEQR
jgi:small subunit ribosomal protein S5